MVKALLIIRLKQIYRELIGIGLIRLVFLIALIGFLGLFLYTNTSDKTTSQLVSIGLLFLISILHSRRGDKLFLKSHFSNYKLFLFSEYAVISSPILLLLVVHRQWGSLIYFLSLILIVHLDLKPKYSSLNTKLQSLIPSDSFEWKAGVRKQFFIIVPVWIISAVTSFFIGSVPIAIFILGISIFSFYEKGETYQMILSYELKAKKFLFLKVKRQFQLFSIITIPLIGLFLIFNFDRWYIPLSEFLIFCFIHIYVIMTKYAFFEPNKKSAAAQTMGGIGVFGGIIPVFLPVVWILTVWFYIKSINNLNFYLNDYN
ncbi:hypothetical protein [Plebeiibacterium marinum]|uniref:Uncharacterized protein n=1 Tax=Plebeiibacterium marinum TaxID=2992111 RepID=A0AAE3MC26_9BACT|nr:hypothetical protein [Plebeiobacterium marinum]MCW3804809.1 hypothetical protein [Plebeiobacterium marinum]